MINVTDYCKKYKLHRGNLVSTCDGKRNHTNGFVGKRITKNDVINLPIPSSILELRATERVYQTYKHILNPSNLPRTLHGEPGGHQVDHIKGIRECFDAKWSVQETAALNNLQFISWEDNLARRKFRCLKQIAT